MELQYILIYIRINLVDIYTLVLIDYVGFFSTEKIKCMRDTPLYDYNKAENLILLYSLLSHWQFESILGHPLIQHQLCMWCHSCLSDRYAHSLYHWKLINEYNSFLLSCLIVPYLCIYIYTYAYIYTHTYTGDKRRNVDNVTIK